MEHLSNLEYLKIRRKNIERYKRFNYNNLCDMINDFLYYDVKKNKRQLLQSKFDKLFIFKYHYDESIKQLTKCDILINQYHKFNNIENYNNAEKQLYLFESEVYYTFDTFYEKVAIIKEEYHKNQLL